MAFQGSITNSKDTTDPKVSIIIPVYNGEKYIAEAIESALGQTYRNFEIIVVNDGSNDNSYEKIKPFLPSVKYIFQENQGVAAARNTGIKNSSGELVAFLDQDDLWLPEKLEVQVNYLLQNPDVGLVHSNMSYINEEDKPVEPYFGRWQTDVSGWCFRDLFIDNRIAILTVLLRRECLDQLGFFNEKYASVDDYDLMLRISRKYPIGHIDRELALYRIHGKNTSRNWAPIDARRIEILETMISSDPGIVSELGKKVVKDRILSLYRDVAEGYASQQEYKMAHKYWSKAVRLQPVRFESYLKFIWNSLTPTQRKAVSWYKHKIMKLVRAQ